MIRGLGIDALEIERFVGWTSYTQKRLMRIFTESELAYCFSVSVCTAERLAVRFAAKEAFFKALSSVDTCHGVSFLRMARHVSVAKHPCGSIYLTLDYPALQALGVTFKADDLKVHLSASHTRTTAIACVIIEQHTQSPI